MLRNFLRLISPSQPTAQTHNESASIGAVIHYARVEQSSRQPGMVNHRHWLLGMKLDHVNICGAKRCEMLRRAGIVTAGDLAVADPIKLTQKMGVPKKAAETLKRYSRAIHLAAAVPGMMPRDAQLLIGIHRTNIQSLALESPIQLHRDLQRFALSSRGRRLIRGRRLPSLRRIKAWVAACQAQCVEPKLQSLPSAA